MRTFIFSGFFISLVGLFAFSPSENFSGDEPYTYEDTLRVDKIVAHIVKNLPDTSSEKIRVVRKSYNCEYSLADGFVDVYYSGKNVVWVSMSECGDDHGGGEVNAAFSKGHLVYYCWNFSSWAFDMDHYSDSSQSTYPTIDVTQESRNYIDAGKVIKCEQRTERSFSPSGEKTEEGDITYFSGCLIDGDAVRWENELKTWIEFANSPKTYAEFFGGELH